MLIRLSAWFDRGLLTADELQAAFPSYLFPRRQEIEFTPYKMSLSHDLGELESTERDSFEINGF